MSQSLLCASAHCSAAGLVMMHLEVIMTHASQIGLGLLVGTEAPVVTPNGVDFSFLFFLSQIGSARLLR